MISYKTIDYFKPGIIQRLIKNSYQHLIPYFPAEKERFYKQWEQEDKNAFKNPDSIGKHVLFTCLNNIPIGYFSWDDRKYPQGIIGQNCIRADYQNQGYGKKQIELVISKFKESGFHTISVISGDHIFFTPAQKMYLSCGFQEQKRFREDLFEQIEYTKML